MMKCIVYLAYYFNDQVLLSSIKNEKNINFLHMKNEIIKLLINNVESCLSLIQDLTPEYDIKKKKKKKKLNNKKKRSINKKIIIIIIIIILLITTIIINLLFIMIIII